MRRCTVSEKLKTAGRGKIKMNYLEIKQKFIGYNEDFYDAIPWAQAKERYGFPKFEPRIAPSFAEISEKLRYRADNPKVYYEYGLPDDELIREFVLASPGLLFYANELARLLRLFTEREHMLSLLSCKSIFSHLSRLHSFPGVFEFLELYPEYASAERLLGDLTGEGDAIFNGMQFCAMSEYEKARAVKLLKERKTAYILGGSWFSTPLGCIDSHLNDRVIWDFTFRSIVSERDRSLLESQIIDDDELPEGYYYYGDIYSVGKAGDVPIALLYVDDGTVENTFIRKWYRDHPDPKLLAAILQWTMETGHSIAPGAINGFGG